MTELLFAGFLALSFKFLGSRPVPFFLPISLSNWFFKVCTLHNATALVIDCVKYVVVTYPFASLLGYKLAISCHRLLLKITYRLLIKITQSKKG